MGTLCQAQAHRYARGLQVVYTLGLGCKAREEQRLFLCLLPSVHLILLNQIRQGVLSSWSLSSFCILFISEVTGKVMTREVQ